MAKLLPPKSVELQLTYSCNLRCKMCGQWGPTGIFKENIDKIKSKEINTDLWKKVIDMASEWDSRILLWGGEPLLRKDVFEIIGYVKSKGLKCSMVTNGTLIGKYYKEIVGKVDKIFLSVDGTSDVHDEIRGQKGTFNRIFEGMEKLKSLKKEKGTNKPVVAIMFTITRYNYNIIEKMPEVAKKLNTEQIYLEHLMFTTEKTKGLYEKEYFKRFGDRPTTHKGWTIKDTGINAKELIKKVNLVLSKAPNDFIVIDDNTRVPFDKWYKNADGTFGYNKCMSPWLRLNVLPDGKVNFCVDFPDYIIGDVNKESLSDIWYGKRANLFREKYLERGPLPICNRCCWLYNDYERVINEWKYSG